MDQYKTVDESRTEQIQIIMPEHINGYNRLFGGRLVEWIDVVAGVVARRHSNCNVTTAAIDSLTFRAAAYVNSTIVLSGRITYVGNTSMEIKVNTFVEQLDGSRQLINKAILVMVALDENEQPVQVPKLLLRTDKERADWETGLRRSKLRKQRRIEKF